MIRKGFLIATCVRQRQNRLFPNTLYVGVNVQELESAGLVSVYNILVGDIRLAQSMLIKNKVLFRFIKNTLNVKFII